MSTLNASATLKKQSVPASPAPAGIIVYRLMKDGVQVAGAQAAVGGTGPSFSNVADGTYTVEAQAKAMDGSFIGDVATSAPITVVNMAEVDVPDVVSVTLG